jgi:hypothetical protein
VALFRICLQVVLCESVINKRVLTRACQRRKSVSSRTQKPQDGSFILRTRRKTVCSIFKRHEEILAGCQNRSNLFLRVLFCTCEILLYSRFLEIRCRRRRRVSTGQKKREAIDRKKRKKVSSGSVDRISGRMMLLRHWSDPGLLIKGEWKHRCVGSKSRVARVSTIRAHKKRRHGVAATNRTFRYTLTRGHPRTPIYG